MEVVLTAGKTVNGRTPGTDEVFSFELLDGDEVLQTARNEGESIVFEAIAYTAADAGKRFTYTVREAADSRPYYLTDARTYTVMVSVAVDPVSGRLLTRQEILCDGAAADNILFNNTYTAEGSLQLTALKSVNGGTPTADQVYEFSLEGEGLSMTATNEGESIVFDPISYDLADAGNTFTYTVRETTQSAANLTTDETVYTVEVAVIDNGDGTLTALPVYKANGAQVSAITFSNRIQTALSITKTVVGCQTDETFGFTVHLFDADGEPAADRFPCHGDVTGEIASGDTIRLGHGQTVVIEGLTPGMQYRVEEDVVPAFTTTVNGRDSGEAEGVLTGEGTEVAFVNTHVTTEFTVTKQWRGEEGGPITLTLYANGEKLDPQPECTRTGYQYKYSGLPMYDAEGELIIYTAKEKYMEGYKTMYVNIAPHKDVTNVLYNGATVINKQIVEMDFMVQKVWDGLEEGETAPDITLVLYCNGEATDYLTPDPDENGWYKYVDLPKYYGGVAAEYTVREQPQAGYVTTYTLANGETADYADNGGAITNTRIPQTGDDAPLALWTTLAGTSAALLLVLMLRNRRKA